MKFKLTVRWVGKLPGGYEQLQGDVWEPITAGEIAAHLVHGMVLWNPQEGYY